MLLCDGLFSGSGGGFIIFSYFYKVVGFNWSRIGCFCVFSFVQISVSYGFNIELNCFDSVVIFGNDIVYVIWIVVGINDVDNWNIQFIGFGYCNVFMINVDYK